MHHGLEASHYHLGPSPYDFHGHNGGDVHHPTPMRPVPTGLEWSETTPRAYHPESSSSQYYPPTSISQPSMFVSSHSSRSLAPNETTSTVDHSAPPPPWTMSGSLDPSTGVYMVAPEHPRIRTGEPRLCSTENKSIRRVSYSRNARHLRTATQLCSARADLPTTLTPPRDIPGGLEGRNDTVKCGDSCAHSCSVMAQVICFHSRREMTG